MYIMKYTLSAVRTWKQLLLEQHRVTLPHSFWLQCTYLIANHLSSFLETVFDKSADINDLVVIEDFNINVLNNNISRSMDDNCQSFDLHHLIDEPTRVTESTSTLIDHIYVSEPALIITSGVIQLGISHHFGIFGSRTVRNYVGAKERSSSYRLQRLQGL